MGVAIGTWETQELRETLLCGLLGECTAHTLPGAVPVAR